jgi:hypothetical protein
MFPLFASWIEFAGTPVVAQFDSHVKRGCVQRVHMKQITTENIIQEWSSVMVFASVSMEIKVPPGISPYHFWIHGHIYLLISDKPGYGQLLRK